MSEINISNPILIYGEPGLSITNISRLGNDLYVDLNNGTQLSVSGVKGDKGDAGVGIQSAALDANGFLVITLTDNSTITSTEQVRGPKGDNGTTGADVNGGSVTDNQITITKSDGSTVQLSGQINAASEAVGDMKATARNDVSAINYLPINTTTDTIHDKAVEPDLWEVMKEYQGNDLIYDVNDTIYEGSYQTTNFGTQSNLLGLYFFNGKWIRIIQATDYFVFQVSNTFDFSTFSEYPIFGSNSYIKSICFIPEKNVILINQYLEYRILKIDLQDADELIDYTDINYGGTGLKQVQEISINNDRILENGISSAPLSTDCYFYMREQSTDIIRFILLDDLLTQQTPIIQQISESILTTDGYSKTTDFHMSGNKIYFYNSNSQVMYSKNIENNSYSTEIDLSIESLTYASFSNNEYISDGCLMFQTNLQTYVINKYKDENVFKQINRINHNLNNTESVLKYYAKSNVVISYLPEATGLNLASNASKIYFVSYDDGLTWNQFFYNPYRTYWQFKTSGDPQKNRNFNDFIFYVCGYSSGVGFVQNYANHFFLIEFQEEGYSDLFTVQSLYLNDDVKGFLRRKP